MSNLPRKKSLFVTVLNKDGTYDTYTISGIYLSEEKISLYLKNKYENIEKIVEIVSTRCRHICRYCGKVTKGTEKDLLCDECKETFGHSFYSEL